MRTLVSVIALSISLSFGGIVVAAEHTPASLWGEVERLQAEVDLNEGIAKGQVEKHQNKSAAARYQRVIEDSTVQLQLLDKLFVEDPSLDGQLEVMSRMGIVKQRVNRVKEMIDILQA